MTTKLLTISIAAYNVEQYIEQTLESLTQSQYIDQLEIFVVDDGGKDQTIAIANRYKQLFPNSIIPVEKENGGYGSTVNYSLKHATGKYFRLLDGDDWVNTEQFDGFLAQLQQCESDAIITDYAVGPSTDQFERMSFDVFKSFEPFHINDYPLKPIGMWALTYRTALLQQMGFELPEHLFYTDQYFCTLPFKQASLVVYLPYSVYFYRIGRDGQSVSRESRIKNIDQTLKICRDLCLFAAEHPNLTYVQYRVTFYYLYALRSLLLLEITKDNLKRLTDYEAEIKSISPSIYKNVVKASKFGKLIAGLRVSRFAAYWLLKFIPGGMKNWG